MLEFGDLYIRFIQDGAQILEASKTILASPTRIPAWCKSTRMAMEQGTGFTFTLTECPR
jgi:hypothetical protein